MTIQVVLKPRAGVGELIEACVRGDLAFDSLCAKVRAMGFKTTSLYEMVLAAEAATATGHCPISTGE